MLRLFVVPVITNSLIFTFNTNSQLLLWLAVCIMYKKTIFSCREQRGAVTGGAFMMI